MLSTKIIFRFGATHTPVCVIGGGSAGLNFVSQIIRADGFNKKDIRVFDQSIFHYYQPMWTMTAGKISTIEKSKKVLSKVFPEGIAIEQHSVKIIKPEENKFITGDGKEWTYDQLLVVPGIIPNFSLIPGLEEALKDLDCPVGSAYDFNYAEKFNNLLNHFTSGDAIFTEPQMPIKCAGAPQKVMYLSECFIRRQGFRQSVKFQFRKTVGTIFGVPKFAVQLDKIIKEKDIDLRLKSKLVQVKGKERKAVFECQDTKKLEEVSFDLLHVVPPHTPPKFIAESGIADAAGFVDVDQHTLIHKKYDNIWSMGDASSCPCAKTAAAVMAQTPILIHHFLQVYQHKKTRKDFDKSYDGYAGCPILLGDNKVLLAEFKYGGIPDETFPWIQGPSRLLYWMKAHFFPVAYWSFMSKGLWFGKNAFFKPK